jgi:hypothetical protein
MPPEPIVRAALRVLHVAGYTTRNWTGTADAPTQQIYDLWKRFTRYRKRCYGGRETLRSGS